MESEKRLIEYEKVYQYAFDGVHGGGLEDEDFQAIINAIDSVPTVDAVEVEDKELLKAIKILVEQYSHSKRSDYVHSPVAHALFHTWKKVDEAGRRKEKQ